MFGGAILCADEGWEDQGFAHRHPSPSYLKFDKQHRNNLLSFSKAPSPPLLDDYYVKEGAEMVFLADGKGDLIQRSEILCVNGVRYLIEPVHEVSVYEHLPSI